MKKASAILMTLIMAAALTACGGDGTGDAKQPNGTEGGASDAAASEGSLDYDKLIIGVDDTFAPMGFLDENNELTGFDIEMAKAVGEKLGVSVEFQTIDWSMKEQELNQGNIDLIWNGYSVTDERAEKVLFTDAYLDNKQVVVTMADSGIKSLADLNGKVVAVQADSSAVNAIESMPEIGDTFAERPEFATNDEAIMDMEAGRSDAVVADSVLLNYVISHKDDPSKYVILDEDFGSEEFAVGVRKEDTALCDAINEAFKELKDDGKAGELSVKWFGEDIVK